MQNCETKIHVLVKKDTISGLISDFTIEITDSKNMYDEIKSEENAAEEKRKKQLEQEIEKNNKPKL